MQEKKRKNKYLNADENPFLNDKLYPIIGMITSSFMDNYIANNYRPYENFLSTDNLDSNNINTKYTNLSSILESIFSKFKELSDNANENNLEDLQDIYTAFCNCFDRVNKSVNNSDIEKSMDMNVISTVECGNDYKKYIRKQKFVETLYHYFYDPLTEIIDDYNSKNTDTCIFIDTSEILCVHKAKGIINNINSNLSPYELNIIRQYKTSFFDTLKKQFKLKHDALFVVYAHILLGIKNRPFGLVITDTRKNSIMQGIDLYNSSEVANMLQNGFMKNYIGSLSIKDEDELEQYNFDHFNQDDDNDEE